MFGWARNNRIIVVFGIEIALVYPNTNLLFQNSKNNYCYSMEEIDNYCFSQLSVTIPNKQFKQHSYYSE
jgi:hypothetical protein